MSVLVPASAVNLARLFSIGDTPAAIAHALQLIGEEYFKVLTDHIAELDGAARDTLLESVCEAWQSSKPVADAVNLLGQLPASTALRTKLAQLISVARPDLIHAMLPFYRDIAGL